MHGAVENTLKLLLSPVLIWQGLRVRKHALVLPEASGERFGVCGAGPALRVLILGDSSAAGVGVETQQQALAGQLVDILSNDYQITWTVLAQTGGTTASTLYWLQNHPAVSYDVAVVALGVNDVTRSVPLRRWVAQTGQLFDLLGEKFAVRRIYTSALPPLGHFPALPHPLRWLIGLTASRYEKRMAAYQAARSDVERSQLDLPLDPALMASDGYHPSATVYTLWAQQLAQKITADFAQESGGKPPR